MWPDRGLKVVPIQVLWGQVYTIYGYMDPSITLP